MIDALETFLAAASPEARVDSLVRLISETRRAGPESRSTVGAILSAVEASPGNRNRFLGSLSALLAETDGTALFGEVGIPSDRGFVAELGDRISARLIPSPRDAHDLSAFVARLFESGDEVEAFGNLPLSFSTRWKVTTPARLFVAGREGLLDGAKPRVLSVIPRRRRGWGWCTSDEHTRQFLESAEALSDVHRFVRLLQAGLTTEAAAAVSRGFADGFRLLLSRIQAQGLSRDLRTRSTPGPVYASAFHRILRSGDDLLDAWVAGRNAAPALQAFNKDSGDCRKEVRLIHRHLEDAGVSINVVFGLQVIDRCLTRTALMADVMEGGDGPERSRALHRLLSRLVQLAHQDRSIFHLVRWNLHLLDRKIVDRTGKTGEHYVASTGSEYRHIWLAAAGGGALTVLTAAFKMLVHEWHLAPFPESFLFGLNYAVSFLLMQAFGFVLATKQPAMTAAAVAQIMREATGEDREERIAGFFARLTSSQLAAAVSNVVTVGVGAAVFVGGWLLLAGHPWVDEKTARDTFLVLSPLDSGTIFFAALTGVLLYLGSLAGGWFENWSTYHRLPEGIARHPLGRLLGAEGMKRFADGLERNASGIATNVALGFLLGFAPAVGRFFGIPFDVRHVTLSTGQLALAASSLGEGWFGDGAFLRGLAGIGVMFVLNLSVSFALSLFNAARAYEMPAGELAGVLRHVFSRALRRPFDFVRPPRAAAGEVSSPPASSSERPM